MLPRAHAYLGRRRRGERPTRVFRDHTDAGRRAADGCRPARVEREIWLIQLAPLIRLIRFSWRPRELEGRKNGLSFMR